MTTSSKRVKPPIKGPGSKSYLADWIISHFPSREKYLTLIETHCLSAAVTFAHDPADKSEIINDLNGQVTNFFQVLQGEDAFAKFKRRVETTPFSKPEFDKARRSLAVNKLDILDIDSAADFFVATRQSMMGAGKSFAAISTKRLRRGMNEQVSAWLTSIDNLQSVHQRLMRVLIFNEDGTGLIQKYDKPGVLFYTDCPYLHETRSDTNMYGEFEMTCEQHEGLLKTAVSLKHAKMLLSGYRNEMYDTYLHGWHRHATLIDNKMSKADEKPTMTECLWANYE